jgi:hypothetical protein
MTAKLRFFLDWITPSKAGTQRSKVKAVALDPRFRGGDE